MSDKFETIPESLVTIESSFRWAVQEPVSSSGVTKAACMHITLVQDIQISKQLHASWEVESLGIINEKTQSPEDTEALQSFEQIVKLKNTYMSSS